MERNRIIAIKALWTSFKPSAAVFQVDQSFPTKQGFQLFSFPFSHFPINIATPKMLIKLHNLADTKKKFHQMKSFRHFYLLGCGVKEKIFFFGAISKRLSICQKGFMKETRP